MIVNIIAAAPLETSFLLHKRFSQPLETSSLLLNFFLGRPRLSPAENRLEGFGVGSSPHLAHALALHQKGLEEVEWPGLDTGVLS